MLTNDRSGAGRSFFFGVQGILQVNELMLLSSVAGKDAGVGARHKARGVRLLFVLPFTKTYLV